MTHLSPKTCLLPSLGLITQLDRDHIIVSQSALVISSGLYEVAMGVWSTWKLSKLYIFPNISKMKRLSFSPHSVHFAVGVTRHLGCMRQVLGAGALG